jgi:hypothetical protein
MKNREKDCPPSPLRGYGGTSLSSRPHVELVEERRKRRQSNDFPERWLDRNRPAREPGRRSLQRNSQSLRSPVALASRRQHFGSDDRRIEGPRAFDGSESSVGSRPARIGLS